MLGFGIPCIVLGTSAMIRNKSLHSAPHFTSWHGVSTPACWSAISLSSFLDLWHNDFHLAYRTGNVRGGKCLVWRRRSRRWREGEGSVEVPQVVVNG